MKRKTFIALALGVLVLAVAAALGLQQRAAREADRFAGEPLAPGLADRLNAVQRIVVEHGGKRLEIVRGDSGWTLPAAHGYAADLGKVRALLLGLADLRLLEPKTARPENYAKLDVDDPGEGRRAKGVTLEDGEGKPLLALVVGRAKPGAGALFVRRRGEAQAYLVEGRLDLPVEAEGWWERRVLDIPRERIRAVTIRQPDGARLHIHREKAEDKDFAVDGIPAGRELRYPGVANGIATGLVRLDMDDVTPAEGFAWDEAKAVEAVYETFDGLKVHVAVLEKDGRHYARFRAEGTDEAQELNRRLEPWVYAVPPYKADKFTQTMEDLLKKVDG